MVFDIFEPSHFKTGQSTTDSAAYRDSWYTYLTIILFSVLSIPLCGLWYYEEIYLEKEKEKKWWSKPRDIVKS